MTGRPILTAAEMRDAEARAIAAGTPVEVLMERAGRAAAEAIRRFAGPIPALILCGPGNNGGDGYVIARVLADRGVSVRVAALGEPSTPAARAARDAWGGTAETLDHAEPATLLIDALFGTGLRRPLDADVADRLAALAASARLRAAIDLPSGAASDDGALLSPVPDFDLTVTFATLKPSHLLQPVARHMGRLVIADIGIAAASDLSEIGRPLLREPGPDDHKYRRGLVLVVGGAMPGAAALAAGAALRGGAGYVVLTGEDGAVPSAVVRRARDDLDALLADERVGAVLVGPGLGRDAAARRTLEAVLASPHPIVLDGDALWLLGENQGFDKRPAPTIATPHEGEFRRAFGAEGSKVEAARAAAARSGMVVAYKGADTVVAAPDGRAAIAAPAPHWLATAGTGDVLGGLVASRLAAGDAPFDAACAAVWLHARAAALAGPALIADDLIGHLPAAVAECL
ncbi:MAG TPA: NAD(P)H-hydrate dehydratase [Allosphingosinicella sp.]|nr:NAD(P)H-hydrate dehydratase [Allosphingosinicella sp.]